MRDSTLVGANCSCMLMVLVFNVVVGGWSVEFLLNFFGRPEIPFWGVALSGLFVGEVSIPVAVVAGLLRYFGVI